MRIAFLLSGFPLQGYLRDMLEALASAGTEVELIAESRSLCGYVDPKSLSVSVDVLAPDGPLGGLARRGGSRLAAALRAPIDVNGDTVVGAARRALAGRRIDLFVGVEKGGLALAAALAADRGTPFVYYSLELYIEGHPRESAFAWSRAQERRLHALASGTIIQDPLRWQLLRAANWPVPDRVFFLPVGAARRQLSPAAARLGTKSASFTLVYLGVLSSGRLTTALVRQASRLSSGITLRVHGPAFERCTLVALKLNSESNVTITTGLVPEAELDRLVRSARIGLALYRPDSVNDVHTAYSSAKVAMYLRAGLPIIAFRGPSYEHLLGRFSCGRMIDHLDEIDDTVRDILLNYGEYASEARRAYSAVFALDRYWPDLAGFFEETVAHQRWTAGTPGSQVGALVDSPFAASPTPERDIPPVSLR